MLIGTPGLTGVKNKTNGGKYQADGNSRQFCSVPDTSGLNCIQAEVAGIITRLELPAVDAYPACPARIRPACCYADLLGNQCKSPKIHNVNYLEKISTHSVWD